MWIVSIPNGMEFYATVSVAVVFILLFQFPTGWNSTNILVLFRLIFCSFNSQRDGILRYEATWKA